MDKRMEKLLRALGYGFAIGFVSYIISGSDVSAPLGLAIAYAEYRFK